MDKRFAALMKSLSKDDRYSDALEAYAQAQASGKKVFGSDALRSQGKIFAMVSSRGQFVVKLHKSRVAELVADGHGLYFDAGKGKPLKEWLVVTGTSARCVSLAKEAFEFVSAA